MPVNPKRGSVAGVAVYRDVAALPIAPDLAVICTPASTVPDLVEEIAELGTRAVVVLRSGHVGRYPGRRKDRSSSGCSMRLDRTCCGSWGPTVWV